MIGGKSNSATKPTALGTQLNAGVYGMTQPTIIGTTLSTFLLIWAANLRKGRSSKKDKKGKGPPTYIENVDMLIGSNPIEGVLQIWANNTNRYTMDFVKFDVNNPVSGSGLFPWMNHMTVVDSHFYFVIGVTVDVVLAGTFNDYGDPTLAGGILHVEISLTPGSGYAVNDTFSINAGNGDAIGQIISVSGGGVPTAFILLNNGSGYTAPAFNQPTITITGGGSGLFVSIFETGKRAYNETSERSMWNLAQHGPDITNPNQVNLYPYVYYWNPACGNLVYFPAYNNTATFGLHYHIYYMRMTRASGFQSPLSYNRMHFEQVLGGPDATEYADAGLTAQQDPHPCVAGAGSSRIDLGASGMMMDWRPEIKGSHCTHPHGDADFVDMIQDTMMSGVRQVGAQLGFIQRGLNCNALPGPIQQYFDGTLEPVIVNNLIYAQPNTLGNVLLVFFRWRPSGGSDAVVSDTAVDAWTNVFVAPYCVFAYANSVGAVAGNIVSGTSSLSGFAFDSRGYIFEMDPGSNTVIASDATQGTGGTLGQVITVTVNVDQACYLMVAGEVENFQSASIPPHWDTLQIDDPNLLSQPVILMKRYVTAAGTYTFSLTLNSGYWNLGMVAIAGQPSPLPKSLGDIIDHDTLELTRMQDHAFGLIGSIAMRSQRKGSEWLAEFYQCANAAPVWSGDVLKTIPRSEVSFAGNGTVFTSYYASGPIATLTANDLIGDASTSPVVIKRKAQVDANNVDKIQFCDRGNDYNHSTASQPESAAITFAGPRPLPPTLLEEIQDPMVARKILTISVRRKTHLLNTYSFTATQKWSGLEARDLIKIPDPNDLLQYIDVILTKVIENDNLDLECEAEPFIYGLDAPNDNLGVTVVNGYKPDSTIVPDLVNTPIFLEPPLAMTINNVSELWIPISDVDPNYGGCFVWISTDGGSSYGNIPISTIFGSAITGVLTSSWPAGLDPDVVNDLALDLTESLGALASYPVVDMNNFVHPFYVEGATTCGYELGAYSIATLTGTNLYTLSASPNGLRRAVYHQPLSGSVAHAAGKRFAFLGTPAVPASIFGDGSGIAKLAMQDIWIGQTLFFKFQAFNALSGGLQDLADCAPYSYVPGGCAVIPSPDIVTIPVASPAPGDFTVAHGLLTTPLFAIIQMSSGGMIVLQRPLAVDATNVYLTATDTGLTANVSFFFAPADASVPLSPSVGGTFSVPHGLASTPTLGIVQIDSLGDIWKGSTPYTSTSLNLVASDGPLTGKDYAWLVAPRTPTLTRFAAIALAPGAAGNFSVPHGLGVVPKLIIVRMSSGGAIWLQVAGSISADVTNLLLMASDLGITGEAEVWA